ncbi:hypothetical protein AK812_SmicGene18585 [Symbiodinium microadriaticum]|uniref:Pentatricopeptide repeat-containing protein, chloroplastic n=1 Tax=Symbiodinium microadriaticum TaxID=2951 RepID=A0A1Q9DUR4_SYMMI|nr:hypothetical protein AK812_SmicGene18585 [Symbiodinium microadriaticum]
MQKCFPLRVSFVLYNRRNSLDPYITWTAAVMLQKFVLPPILQTTIMHHAFRAQKCATLHEPAMCCLLSVKACQILRTARSCDLQVDSALTNAGLLPLVASGADWSLALAALGIFGRELQPSEISLSLSARVASWPAAMRLVRSGKEISLRPNLLVLAAVLQSLPCAWAQGLSLRRVAAVAGLGWDRVVANLVAASCANAGRWAVSLHQLPLRRDEVSVGIAGDCCGQGRLWGGALRLLASLRAGRLETSQSAFGATAAQQWSQALALLRWLWQVGDLEGAGCALPAAIQSCTSTAPGRWSLALYQLGFWPAGTWRH